MKRRYLVNLIDSYTEAVYKAYSHNEDKGLERIRSFLFEKLDSLTEEGAVESVDDKWARQNSGLVPYYLQENQECLCDCGKVLNREEVGWIRKS